MLGEGCDPLAAKSMYERQGFNRIRDEVFVINLCLLSCIF